MFMVDDFKIDMKVSEKYPPNFKLIKAVFPNCGTYKSIFCFGDTIYNPFGARITPDLEVHERVHEKQQGENPRQWWNRYLTEPAFRLEQEIEAYGAQYHFVKYSLKLSSKWCEWLLNQAADSLSHEQYGNLVEFAVAKSRIRNIAKDL